MNWRPAQVIFGLLVILLTTAPARAHDWYPIECCHGMDCAPVDRMDVTDAGGITVTSRMGTAVVPPEMPRRESKDNRMHVCMRPSLSGGMKVICVFVPPST